MTVTEGSIVGFVLNQAPWPSLNWVFVVPACSWALQSLTRARLWRSSEKGNGISWHLREAPLAEHEEKGEAAAHKVQPIYATWSHSANQRYTPIKYITLTLWLVEGAKYLSAEWVLAVTSVIQLPAYLRFYFQMWLTVGWLWHSRRKHTACYYACINIFINTRCTLEK